MEATSLNMEASALEKQVLTPLMAEGRPHWVLVDDLRDIRKLYIR